MAQLLLKMSANLSGKRSKDGQKHRASRYVPWATAESFAKDCNATIDDIIERHEAARKAKKISGVSLDGTVVTDAPYVHDGFGATGKGVPRGKLNRERFLLFLAKGITLAHQQEMQNLLFAKYGDPTKATKTEQVDETEEDVL